MVLLRRRQRARTRGGIQLHLLSSGSIHWDTDSERGSRNDGTKSEFSFQWVTFWILSNIEMETSGRQLIMEM